MGHRHRHSPAAQGTPGKGYSLARRLRGAGPTSRSTTPSASRGVSSSNRPIARAPSQPPGIAPARPATRIAVSTPTEPAWVAKPATPSRKPTTSSSGCARTSRPTPRRSASIRSVPRMTPTAPPSAPMPSPRDRGRPEPRPLAGAHAPAATPGRRRSRRAPLRSLPAARARRRRPRRARRARRRARTAAPSTRRRASRPGRRAGGRRRRAGRRGRDGDVRPGGRERAAGDEDDQGQPQRPEHEAGIEPGYPAANEPTRVAASFQASTEARRSRRQRWRCARG